MAILKKVGLLGLATLMSVVPALAYGSYTGEVQVQKAPVILPPDGIELLDEELLQIIGEQAEVPIGSILVGFPSERLLCCPSYTLPGALPLVSFGIAEAIPTNYLVLLYSANYLPGNPAPQYIVPDGPTYGCWPTGAICNFNCNKWSTWCLIYCTAMGSPTGYSCEAGCQYVCVFHSKIFYFECRDIIPIGCACDIQPRNCPAAG